MLPVDFIDFTRFSYTTGSTLNKYGIKYLLVKDLFFVCPCCPLSNITLHILMVM